MFPYAKQSITEEDVAAVADALRSPWLTTGPRVAEFETAFAKSTGSRHAIAVNSGTAALHASMHAHQVGDGDEIIVPALTFAASANAVIYQGAKPVFADVDPATLLLDPESVESRIGPKTKGIVSVDYAGQPCDYQSLKKTAAQHGLFLHADACHSLGATYQGKPVGTLADSSSFSFHAIKPITTAEGGMITTDNDRLAKQLRIFRNHGITTDHRERELQGTWHYDMEELGYNYRLSDLQCALGLSQLSRLEFFTKRRREIASRYGNFFENHPQMQPLGQGADRTHAYHLYVVRLQGEWKGKRSQLFQKVRALDIALNVHYRPVYQHSFYIKRFGDQTGSCPVAEQAYNDIVSLPMFAGMSDHDVNFVTETLQSVFDGPA